MIHFAQLDLVHLSANVATVLFMVFIGAQLLAAAGVLPVSMFWGGRKTELTPSLRIMGVVAAVLLSAFIYVIRYRAGLVGGDAVANGRSCGSLAGNGVYGFECTR